MNRLKFITLLITLLLSISCATIKTAVNTVTDNNPVKSKFIAVEVPKDIKNAVMDKHSAEENAVIISQNDGYVFNIGDVPYPLEVVGDKLKSLFNKTPSERQLIYLNASARMDFDDVVKLLNEVRKQEVENVGLWVQPADKKEAGFYILKIKIPAEPKDDDSSSTLAYPILNLQKDGKVAFASYDPKLGFKPDKQEIKPEELAAKIGEKLKDKTDKTFYIKAARSNSYAEVVRLVDAAAGAGASNIYLQIDDLEM